MNTIHAIEALRTHANAQHKIHTPMHGTNASCDQFRNRRVPLNAARTDEIAQLRYRQVHCCCGLMENAWQQALACRYASNTNAARRTTDRPSGCLRQGANADPAVVARLRKDPQVAKIVAGAEALGAGAALEQALCAGAVTLDCWGKAEGRFQEVARVATRRLDGIPLAWLENR